MIMQVEVEDGVVPAGKEIVRIGWPTRDEHWRSFDGRIDSGFDATKDGVPVVILRDKPSVKEDST